MIFKVDTSIPAVGSYNIQKGDIGNQANSVRKETIRQPFTRPENISFISNFTPGVGSYIQTQDSVETRAKKSMGISMSYKPDSPKIDIDSIIVGPGSYDASIHSISPNQKSVRFCEAERKFEFLVDSDFGENKQCA